LGFPQRYPHYRHLGTNRKAAHLKLDEIIRALKGARNELIDLEKLADEDLTNLEKQFERVRKKTERNGKAFLDA
jgi:low affinity Fe/Cu permease